VLFTDIVDSTRRAAEMGDRDWHALLDAHDAVVRSQLTRFRGREECEVRGEGIGGIGWQGERGAGVQYAA
jgi:class 3 adenylate cyclase